MAIKPLLFSGVKEAPQPRQEISFVDHLSKVMDRRRGVQTLFDLADNAFSWGRLAPVDDSLRDYFSQARCIAILCKSAYEFLRAPLLFVQAVGLWKRGKGVKRSAVHLKDHVSLSAWNGLDVRKVGSAAKEVLGWIAGTMSWMCRTLTIANEALICMISKSVMDTASKVGSISGIVSFGVTALNQAQELTKRATLVETDNRLLRKARQITRDSLVCSTVSSGARLLSSIGSGLRTFSLVTVPVTVSLGLSTIALLFTIRSIYLDNKARLDTTYVRVPV